jgi:hypothetical protein
MRTTISCAEAGLVAASRLMSEHLGKKDNEGVGSKDGCTPTSMNPEFAMFPLRSVIPEN